MASGFQSCHPDQVAALKQMGLASGAVVQGYGWYAASAGTHAPVGRINGQPFGHCIDVSPNALTFTRAHYDALVMLGFAPFPRTNWPGGAHWHLVHVPRPAADGGGHPNHLEGVNHQLAEWVSGGDGLIGDAPMPAEWRPTQAQRDYLKQVWKTGSLPNVPVELELKVIYPPDAGAAGVIDCNPVEEGGVTRCDLRPLAEALGFEVTHRPEQNKVYIAPKP